MKKQFRLKYYNIEPKYMEQSAPESFIQELHNLDRNLEVTFNRVSGRWEIYRLTHRGWDWILCVEDENENYRPLDMRTINKLKEMDIIARWGSVAEFEKHLDEKQQKYKDDCQKQIDHETKCDIKDDRKLWQEAAENFRKGIINSPPKVKDRKIISCPK